MLYSCNTKLFVQTRALVGHGTTPAWKPSTEFPAKFLGQETWERGFDNVWVSWSCSDVWKRGEDELFYSPGALHMLPVVDDAVDGHQKSASVGGAKWVPIETLCWVLEPGKLFDPVLGEHLDARVISPLGLDGVDVVSEYLSTEEVDGSRCLNGDSIGLSAVRFAFASFPEHKEEADRRKVDLPFFILPWWAQCADELRADGGATTGGSESTIANKHIKQMFDAQKQLVLYYESQIDTLAEMCLDRSYNVINELERHWSYELLTSLMGNERLPDQIRASFTTLLLRVWVDRYPHSPLSIPDHIQARSNIFKYNY